MTSASIGCAMNVLFDDMIDFASYMDLTEHKQSVRSAKEYADDVISYFHDDRTPIGVKLPWKKSHGILRFRPSEVTIWSGFNGHGKSLVLGQACIGFMVQQEKTCIASMEMTPVATLARVCRQGEGCSRPTKEFIQEFSELFGEYFWLYDQQGMVNANKLCGVVNYAATEIGCKHFVIDSLLKCGIGEDDYNAQKSFVDKLCTIARDTGIHIHLVCHSRKGKDEMTPPGKMDVRGAASITDQVDNVLCVYRNKAKEKNLSEGRSDAMNDPDAMLICCKQRHGEWEGGINLWFDPASQQFMEHLDAHPINLLNPGAYEI